MLHVHHDLFKLFVFTPFGCVLFLMIHQLFDFSQALKKKCYNIWTFFFNFNISIDVFFMLKLKMQIKTGEQKLTDGNREIEMWIICGLKKQMCRYRIKVFKNSFFYHYIVFYYFMWA